MRAQIGFKVTDNKLAIIEKPQQEEIEMRELTFEQMMRVKGYEKVMLIVEDYLSAYTFPLLKEPQRDELFIKQLKNVRERFFLPL